MDNAEAIRRIKDHIRVHHIGEYPHIKIAEALNMAISALANDNNVGHKVEVVHGRWGAFEVFPGAASLNGYPCSVCGNRVPATLYNLNYCPNCGADMRGDRNG